MRAISAPELSATLKSHARQFWALSEPISCPSASHPGRSDGFVCYDRDLLDELRTEAAIDGIAHHFNAAITLSIFLYDRGRRILRAIVHYKQFQIAMGLCKAAVN